MWHRSTEGWNGNDFSGQHNGAGQAMRVPSPDYSDSLSVPDELPIVSIGDWTLISKLATLQECVRQVKNAFETINRKPEESKKLDALLEQVNAVERLIEVNMAFKLTLNSIRIAAIIMSVYVTVSS